MPSRTIETVPIASYGMSTTLLKRHKILPHPRQHVEQETTFPSTKNSPASLNTDVSRSPSSQQSSPRVLKHTSRRVPAADLPPTPPCHSRTSSNHDATLKETETRGPGNLVEPRTPPLQQTPHTPEVTPPKAASRPTSLRPPYADRYASSRADSFKTAAEFFSSDEDEASTVRPQMPSAQPSTTSVIRIKSSAEEKRNVGLGLNLRSEETSSPRIHASDTAETMQDPIDPDDEWSPNAGASEIVKEWDDNLMRNVTVRRRTNRISYVYDDSPVSQEILESNTISPNNATQLLRRYDLEDGVLRNGPRMEMTDSSDLQTTRSVEWSKLDESATLSTPDYQRMSVISGRSSNSIIVEAMLVDPVPQRQKTLRHSKKRLGLRELGSDTSGPEIGPGFNVPDEPRRRLVRKSSKIMDRQRGYKRQTASSTNVDARSRKEMWKSGTIPVVVIPDRTSSTKSSRTPSLRSTSSRARRSISITSAPLSRSSHANDLGQFEKLKRQQRAVSESARSSWSQKTADYPPRIPARSSSLSASTSQNTSQAGSRTASLTAESLRAHNRLQPPRPHSPPLLQDATSSTSPRLQQGPRLSVDQHGDPLFGTRLSAQVTPFSVFSYETAATSAELSEAKAVSLFPHQNRSVLMVEHQTQTSPEGDNMSMRSEMLQGANGAVSARHATGVEPFTPPQPIQDPVEVDSPLRYPREPPQPPAIQFIPPTPSGLTPSIEPDQSAGRREPAAMGRPKRSFSLRRALGTRRYSESIIGRTLSLKRNSVFIEDDATPNYRTAGHVDSLYPTVADRPADGTKLHPFWRPARFWDDLEGDEYDDGDYSDTNIYPLVDNRPMPPKRSLSGSLKRTFAILPLKDDGYYSSYRTEQRIVRRTPSGNLRVVKGRPSIESMRRAVSNSHRRPHTSDGRSGGSSKSEDRPAGIVSSWQNLSRRMSEKRREKRNDKLRSMISGPTDAFDPVENVLRKQQQQQPQQPQPQQQQRPVAVVG